MSLEEAIELFKTSIAWPGYWGHSSWYLDKAELQQKRRLCWKKFCTYNNLDFDYPF